MHLLWTERAIDTRLREKFFPAARQSEALNYAVVREGKVVIRKPLQQLDEGQHGDLPGRGRFHVTPDGRLLVLYYVRVVAPAAAGAAGRRVPENRLVEIRPDGTLGQPVKVPLVRPLDSFYTATVRAGCAPRPPSTCSASPATRCGTAESACGSSEAAWAPSLTVQSPMRQAGLRAAGDGGSVGISCGS